MKLTTPNDFVAETSKEKIIKKIESELKEGRSFIELADGYDIPYVDGVTLNEICSDYMAAGWSSVTWRVGQLGTLKQFTFIP